MGAWLKRLDEATRARYDEVVDIYGWLGAFAATLDPERDEDLRTDLFYVDSMVAGWIAPGQFEKAQVPGPVLEAIAAAESNGASRSTPTRDDLRRRLERLRELASS
ncbi:MAG TPA: hypothetical protein PLF56_13645 [Micropruina sp.]|jgi:hypothetical protein|nr:hypothetical protein [Micropruina sp.]